MISSLELAKLCGVSQGTVDRALHGRPGIAEATRKRILEAARLHGHIPNPSAREIMTGRSRCCGAVMPAGASVFFADLFGALERALKKRGLRLLATSAADEAETDEALLELASRRMRGLALVPPSESYALPEGVKAASLAGPCAGAVYIAPDETRTGYAGAEALWKLGHRRIVFVTYSRDARAIRERRDGYASFMRERGAEARVLIRPSVEELLEADASAFFCHNDWLALSTMRELEKAGRKVPSDVSVMGVDDSPSFNALFPGLSTMSYPYEAVAEAAAAAMLDEEIRPAIPDLKAVLRDSTATLG